MKKITPFIFVLLLSSFSASSGIFPQDDAVTEESGGSELPENSMPDEEMDSAGEPGEFILYGFFRNMAHGIISDEKKMVSSHYRARLGMALSHEKLKADFSADTDFIIANYTDSPEFDLYWRSMVRNRALSLEKDSPSREYLARESVHRATIAYESQKLIVKMGRFADSWGQSRLVNPLDLITPSGPFLYDMEDQPGVDGILAQYFTGQFNYLEFAVIPLRRQGGGADKMNAEDVNFLFRHKITLDSTDFFYTAGTHYSSYVAGGDLNVTALGASFRLAYLYRRNKSVSMRIEDPVTGIPMEIKAPHRDVHTGVAGFGYAFWGKLRTNMEVLYNGSNIREIPELEPLRNLEILTPGTSADDAAFYATAGRWVTHNPWFFNIGLGMDATPVLTLDFILLYDIEGNATYLNPSITGSLGDNANAVFSYRHPVDFKSGKENDFSSMETEILAMIRWYF